MLTNSLVINACMVQKLVADLVNELQDFKLLQIHGGNKHRRRRTGK
jgi:hypothetical protein